MAEVVVLAAPDDFVRFFAAVDMGDLCLPVRRAGRVFVCEEVVGQPVDHVVRTVRDVFDISVQSVALENTDDLVVRFVPVQHAETADWSRLQKDVSMRDVGFHEDADVQWMNSVPWMRLEQEMSVDRHDQVCRYALFLVKAAQCESAAHCRAT